MKATHTYSELFATLEPRDASNSLGHRQAADRYHSGDFGLRRQAMMMAMIGAMVVVVVVIVVVVVVISPPPIPRQSRHAHSPSRSASSSPSSSSFTSPLPPAASQL